MLHAVGRRTTAVGCIVALCAGVVAALWLGPLADAARPVGSGPHLDILLLGLMFAATEAVVLHLQLRRETQTISLSEIPLVLGFVFASPASLLLGRVAGAAVVLAFYRRQPLIKLVYNIATQAAEVSIGLAVFHALAPAHGRVSPQGIVAVYAGVVAGSVFVGWALCTVIGVSEGRIDLRAYLDEIVEYPPIAVGVATFGFVAVYALREGPAGAWALLTTLVVLMGAYRVYARLLQRHQALEQLFRFTQAVGTSSDIDEVLLHVLAEARSMFKAEVASLAVLPQDGDATWIVASLGDDGVLRRDEVGPRHRSVALHRRAADRTDPELVTAGGPRDLRQLLADAKLRDALIAPLRDGSGALGSLVVCDRLGDVGTFPPDDLRLIATVANHASVALRNSRLIDRLRYEATHDTLTGMPNRTGWEVTARAALERGCAPGRMNSVMLVDLDGFKEVNDTLGHQHGDTLLVEVAARITSAVGAAGRAARFGGDEFAVLLSDTTEPAALEVADAIVSAMHEPFSLDGMHIEVRASVGVTWAPRHGTDLTELLKHADLAMYGSKSTASGVTVYNDALADDGVNRLALIADLRQALAGDEVTIAVQPKVSLRTGELSGVEALARWNHPLQGPIPPDVFIALAERSGLIRQLTEHVLEQSVAACAAWRDQGVDVPIAVNFSARALLDDGLTATIADALDRHGLPARLLIVEITESSVIGDPERALAVLHDLRGIGVAISVDDFGTGYSSLSYLKRLPVQEVKIDRSFVANLVDDENDATIVRAIADLGRNLGLDVVAEGVEDLPTWRRLQELGCMTAQGYYLARPMQPARLLQWHGDHALTIPTLRTKPERRRRGQVTQLHPRASAAI